MRLTIRGNYPADWPAIATRAKVEAAWRCVRCRHPFGQAPGLGALACDAHCDRMRCRAERIAQRGGQLNYTVHHLDGDKSNASWWNLLATCNSCHLSIQARVIVERPWLFDHAEWFVPYVCGFYASYYGGVAISRRDAERNPDAWLALNPTRSAG
jgi:hypothetical protein